MSLVFRDPFFSSTQDPFTMATWPERFLGRQGDTTDMIFKPSCDVFESDDKIQVHCDLPGIQKEHIKADINKDGDLVIDAEQQVNKEYDQANIRVKERRYGRFHRTIALPASIDAAKIQATFNNGVLDITVPKSYASQQSRIKIA